MKHLAGFQGGGGDWIAVADFGFVAPGAFDGGGGELAGFSGEGNAEFAAGFEAGDGAVGPVFGQGVGLDENFSDSGIAATWR